MAEERLPGAVTSELMNRIEESAVSAAREILSGRRIIDVEGPVRRRLDDSRGRQ